jgi:aspartate aminotransferase
MAIEQISPRMARIFDSAALAFEFITQSTWAQRNKEPGICDFAVGNPHEMPLEGFTAALQKWSVPQDKDWFAYKTSEPAAREVVAASLRGRSGLPFEADDVFMTNGAFAGLPVSIGTVVQPGDEVIFITPPWFFYEGVILHEGGVPVRAKIDLETFDLDLDAIAAAITDKTRAIIINSPHNPTGKIYSPETLRALAELLTRSSERNGRPIYLVSDEAYNRIVFDGRKYYSPTAFYPYSFLVYTYGKTLLTPGQRLGYVALPPNMPDREVMRAALFTSQMFTGFAVPNALLQHALGDLEKLSIDVMHLQRKRDRLVRALRDAGYEVNVPEGTFYLLARSPWEDDVAFIELLAEHDVFCLPGAIVELPGYFRISLTANDEMVERAIPRFAAAMREAIEARQTVAQAA